MGDSITITKSLSMRPAHREFGRVIVIKGTMVGKNYRIRPNERILIGRDESQCDIIIPSGTVTHVHCELFYEPEREMYIVKDMSKNGTLVDEKYRLPKNELVDIPPGSTLMIGSTKDVIVLDYPDS